MLARNNQHLTHRPKRPLVSDDDLTIDEETMEKAIEFLQSRLKPEELSRLKAMLKGEQAEAEDDDPDEKERDKLPKPGGKIVASDARPNSYADRWPESARIKLGY